MAVIHHQEHPVLIYICSVIEIVNSCKYLGVKLLCTIPLLQQHFIALRPQSVANLPRSPAVLSSATTNNPALEMQSRDHSVLPNVMHEVKFRVLRNNSKGMPTCLLAYLMLAVKMQQYLHLTSEVDMSSCTAAAYTYRMLT